MRTFLPPGPNVTWTASESCLQPYSNFLRACVPNKSSLEAKYLGTFVSRDLERTDFVENMIFLNITMINIDKVQN